jgi:hypothetical protein
MRNVVIARAVAEARRADLLAAAEARRQRDRHRRSSRTHPQRGSLIRRTIRLVSLRWRARADVGASLS